MPWHHAKLRHLQMINSQRYLNPLFGFVISGSLFNDTEC